MDGATNTPKSSGTPKVAGAPESPEKHGDQKEDSEENKLQGGDNADQNNEKDKDVAGDGEESIPIEPVEIPEDRHPTLEKLAEEVEQFISSLPTPTETDAKDEKQESEKDNVNEAKVTEGDVKDEKEAKDEKEEKDVKDEKGEKGEEEKGEKDAKEDETKDEKEGEKGSGEKTDKEEKDVKEETKDDAKDEKESAEKDEKEEVEVFEEELVPVDFLKLIVMFLTWVDEICNCEARSGWGTAHDDDALFLDAVDQMAKMRESLLCLCTKGLKFGERHGGLINRLSDIQHRAMAYLVEEFRILLEESKTESDNQTKSDPNKDSAANKPKNDQATSESAPESSEPETPKIPEFPAFPQEVVSNLNKIAQKMISAGYEYECCGVYVISRKHAFDENLQKLGVEKHSLDDIQKMPWETLEREIVSWVNAVKNCSNVYFSGERKLAESVFSENLFISSYLFSKIIRGVMILLLNFAEGIAMSKRAAEKLFKTLDMYEAVKDLVPKVDDLFPAECCNEIKTETMTVLVRLGEAAICIFCDLENSIKAETGKNPVPGGAVHPLTRYTMNYLRYACEYKQTLELVFRQHAKIERADSTGRPEGREDYDASDIPLVLGDNDSPFAVQLARVMALLDANLDMKSKMYKDIALSSIFMMNNGRYILQKIKGSPEIHACMGDTWTRKRSSELRQYHKNYQRETWSKLLSFLTHEGLVNHGKVSKPVLKERFKSFNAMFDEIHRTQSSWVVSDEQLQSELRVSISAVVIPAYRSFLGRFAQTFDAGRQTEKYVKFQPEDIETYIDELFDGTGPNTSMFRKKP